MAWQVVTEPCRFCNKTFPTWKKLTVHLAKHMEQISIPVIRLVSQKELDVDTIISPRLGPAASDICAPSRQARSGYGEPLAEYHAAKSATREGTNSISSSERLSLTLGLALICTKYMCWRYLIMIAESLQPPPRSSSDLERGNFEKLFGILEYNIYH